ncbi:MAG: translation initiation factor IF-3 [Bacteroidales bacterium]|nr:translation initiation factor IF-3 [Bacteroidales bacterium]
MPQNRKKEEGLRINEEITAPKVRVVGENVPEQGIYPIGEALRMASDQELDLVEIAPNSDPPVCKIIDYQKYVYQQKKKAKELKANASKVVIKEIRFGPQTDEHDYQFKLNHAKSFLKEGSKVKAYVFFRGRSILFSEQGEKLLLRFAVDLEDYGKAEQMPKLEGKRMIMMIAPVKKK